MLLVRPSLPETNVAYFLSTPGGTKGIGRAIVKAYLKEGAIVHFCSRTAKDVDAANQKLSGEESDGRAIGAVVDVTNKV